MNQISVFLDGNSYCAMIWNPQETNIQESPCGFGDTPELALKELAGNLDGWLPELVSEDRQPPPTVPSYELTPELKAQIDAMDHYDMASTWRFASSGNRLIMGETGAYFKDRLFKHFGGFTPEISKSLSRK